MMAIAIELERRILLWRISEEPLRNMAEWRNGGNERMNQIQ